MMQEHHRRAIPRRSPQISGRRVLLSRAALALFLVAAIGCGHGFIVTSEQVLQAAPAVYDAGMTFAKDNKATLPLATLKVFEQIRVQFPPVYRAYDSALEIYVKSDRTDRKALDEKRAALDQIVESIVHLVSANGGPDLGKKYGVPK